MGAPLWEPWSPKVGDRVRVRISAECVPAMPLDSVFARAGCVHHHRAEDGAIGTVDRVDSVSRSGHRVPGHPYHVAFDPGSMFPVQTRSARYLIEGMVYAAIELEKIDVGM